MAEGYEELLAEIDRIVNSPYPTQLKVNNHPLSMEQMLLNHHSEMSNSISEISCVRNVQISTSFAGYYRSHAKSIGWRDVFLTDFNGGHMFSTS